MTNEGRGVSQRERTLGSNIVLVGGVLIGLLSAYFVGYVCLGDLTTSAGSPIRIRAFSHAWLVTVYQPAGRIETVLTRQEVILFSVPLIEP